MDDKQIFNLISYCQIDDNQSIYQYIPRDYNLDLLSINIAEQSIDGGHFIYLVDNDEYTKVLYGNIYGEGNSSQFENRSYRVTYRECMPNSIILPKGQCDQMIQKAYVILDIICKEYFNDKVITH